jgi:hypothetical protein
VVTTAAGAAASSRQQHMKPKDMYNPIDSDYPVSQVASTHYQTNPKHKRVYSGGSTTSSNGASSPIPNAMTQSALNKMKAASKIAALKT